jgi:hypothetical protein
MRIRVPNLQHSAHGALFSVGYPPRLFLFGGCAAMFTYKRFAFRCCPLHHECSAAAWKKSGPCSWVSEDRFHGIHMLHRWVCIVSLWQLPCLVGLVAVACSHASLGVHRLSLAVAVSRWVGCRISLMIVGHTSGGCTSEAAAPLEDQRQAPLHAGDLPRRHRGGG